MTSGPSYVRPARPGRITTEGADSAETLGVAVVGCGLVGRRRAAVAAAHEGTRLVHAVDVMEASAAAVAAEHGASAGPDWRPAVLREDVSVVVVATPNAVLVEVAEAALLAGKHVLVEKPPGRNAAEAERLARAAAAGRAVCKVGFNHRFHPGIRAARDRLRTGAIGPLLNMRARYGHGSRPGCEREWRADARLAGGGELLDQGVHLVDLFRWFAGEPVRVYAELQTAAWRIEPLEDNAFATLRFGNGVVGQFHVSMSQWRNLFSLELAGADGALVVEGLGGSYGPERLTWYRRRAEGGAPEVEEQTFAGADASWSDEWDCFVRAAERGGPVECDAAEGVAVMRVVDALYASAQAARPVTL